VRDLARLGYTQQLFREMGGFSNFAISFSIISVLTGAVLLFGYGLKLAGPIINSVGWPVVSLFTLAVAASMAELASAYPTAGGLYFWAFRLGGRGWAWVTAWLNMIGQVTITAGINVAAATYIIGAATRIAGVPADVPLRPLPRARLGLRCRALRAGVRPRAPPGAVDLHRVRRLRPRGGGDRHGPLELRLGRVPLRRRVGGGRLGAPADPHLEHPRRRPRGDGERRVSRAADRLRQPIARLRELDRARHRRGPVALRPGVDPLAGAGVVGVRPRRREAGGSAPQASESPPRDAGGGDRRYQSPC